MPPTSVLMSKQPLVLTLVPGTGLPAVEPTPPAWPDTLVGKPPSFGPICPYARSISRPRTARTRPTANSKSGRNRVRPYHSLSLLRVRFPSYVFRPIDVIWSKRPEIVTFGTGAWANPGDASATRVTRVRTAATRDRRITALLK